MEKLSNAIKCANCSSILDSPVLLPCGHSICKSHVIGTNSFIVCSKCESKHKIPKVGFLDNKSLAEIIAIQIQKISLGPKYENAKNNSESLKSLIKNFDAVLTDYPTNKMKREVEEIEDLKNQIFLKREELKLKIDQEIDNMVKKFDEYVVRFNNFLSSEQTQMRTKELVESKNKVQKVLDGFENRLNEIVLDDSLWNGISAEASSEYTKLSNRLEEFKKSFIFPDLDDFKQHTIFFRNLDIDFNYRKK